MKNKGIFLLALMAVLLFAFSGCGDSDSEIQSNVITENDLFANPQIISTHQQTFVIHLEHPDGEGHDNDIGEKGVDEVPVYYSESVNHTFCWKDDASDAGHSMELIDSSGNTVLTINNDSECKNATIPAGHYTMRFTHRGQSQETHTIFIRPVEDISISRGIVNVSSVEDNVDTLISTGDCFGCDLSYANLYRANLEWASLGYANLTRADLSHANLSNARMDSANLREAYLSSANLTDAGLIYANLIRADLRAANLTRAYLNGADLTDADLSLADLTDANLSGAILRGADLSGAILRGADLSGAILSGANLDGADLDGADLSGATWSVNTTQYFKAGSQYIVPGDKEWVTVDISESYLKFSRSSTTSTTGTISSYIVGMNGDTARISGTFNHRGSLRGGELWFNPATEIFNRPGEPQKTFAFTNKKVPVTSWYSSWISDTGPKTINGDIVTDNSGTIKVLFNFTAPE